MSKLHCRKRSTLCIRTPQHCQKNVQMRQSTDSLNFDDFFSLKTLITVREKLTGQKFKKGFLMVADYEIINFLKTQKMYFLAANRFTHASSYYQKIFKKNCRDSTCKFLMIDFKDKSFEVYISSCNKIILLFQQSTR